MLPERKNLNGRQNQTNQKVTQTTGRRRRSVVADGQRRTKVYFPRNFREEAPPGEG